MLDPFMTTLGLQAEVPVPEPARAWGVIRPEFLNSWGSAHGGFLYSLADAAFALASNSHGTLAVALAAHMEYLQTEPGWGGGGSAGDRGLSGTTHGGLSGRGAQRIESAGDLHRNGLSALRSWRFAVARAPTGRDLNAATLSGFEVLFEKVSKMQRSQERIFLGLTSKKYGWNHGFTD